jgi:hypothetical protein
MVRRSFLRYFKNKGRNANIMFMKKNKSLLILGLIFCLAVALRIWFVSDNNIMFWFDQSRDAVIATSIIENRDLKIQGPSASGTDDAVYHGVLYYYLIAPLYYFGGGNPQVVSFGLAIFSSLSVLVVYFMTKDIVNKEKIALLVSFLMAVSAISIENGVWLSNPVIMIVSMPLFFWMLWKVFFLGKKKHIYWLLFFFGITNQSAIFTIYLLGPLLIAYFYKANQEKKILIFSLKQYFLGILIYLTTISTMVVTELLLIKRGVLTVGIFNQSGEFSAGAYETLIKTVPFYLNFFFRVFSSTDVLLFFFLLFGIFMWGFLKFNNKKRFYFLISIFSPLWLLSWHFRSSIYIFIGFSVFLYIPLAVGLLKLKKLFKGEWIFYFTLITFLILNLYSLQFSRRSRIHSFAFHEGALLAEQIALIEKTYELTAGKEFSISTSTSPYGVNVTWAYLYDHYGSGHGFLPKFFGPPQAGWVGDNLLEEIDGALENHFTIMDPKTFNEEYIRKQFSLDQTSFSSTPSATYKFGTLILQHRKGKLGSK